MRWIARHCLCQVQYRPGATLVAGSPTAHGGYRWGAGGANTGRKKEIHIAKKPPLRGGVHGVWRPDAFFGALTGLPSRAARHMAPIVP